MRDDVTQAITLEKVLFICFLGCFIKQMGKYRTPFKLSGLSMLPIERGESRYTSTAQGLYVLRNESTVHAVE